MARYLIPLGLFIVLLVFLAIGLRLDPHEVPSPLIGKPAPEFSLPQVQDPTQQVARGDLLGKVSLLNVWASWCVACRDEHPLLVELAKSRTVPIYGLNYKDNRNDALRWLNNFGNPYVTSASDADGKIGIDYGVYGVPETYVIDKIGIIRYKWVGPLTAEILNKEILPLIKKLQG